MTKYVQSGMRRDVLALLAAESRRAQALKTALESHYDEHIDPKTFYGALDALQDAGHVAVSTEGVHDVYELTPGGRRMLEEHVTWLVDTVDPQETPTGSDDDGGDRGDGDDGDRGDGREDT